MFVICRFGPDGKSEDKWVWNVDGIVINRGKLKYSENNLPKCYIVCYISHTDCSGPEPGPPQKLATNHLTYDIINHAFCCITITKTASVYTYVISM